MIHSFSSKNAREKPSYWVAGGTNLNPSAKISCYIQIDFKICFSMIELLLNLIGMCQAMVSGTFEWREKAQNDIV